MKRRKYIIIYQLFIRMIKVRNSLFKQISKISFLLCMMEFQATKSKKKNSFKLNYLKYYKYYKGIIYSKGLSKKHFVIL